MAVIPDGPFIGAVPSHDGGALRCVALRCVSLRFSPLDCAALAAAAPPPLSAFVVEDVAPSCG